jgi:Tfp pilus assembly protein PilE
MEIMIVAAAVGIMVLITMPSFLKERATTHQRACRKQLRHLSAIKQQWGNEHKRPAAATPTPAQLQIYFDKHRMPVCPSRGTYTLRQLNLEPTCTRAALGHTF